MSLMSAGYKNPFVKIDKQSVIGALKATGSQDRDVLHTQKNELLATPKSFKTIGIICMAVGALFTVIVILAFAGIPFLIFGWWLWRRGKKNIETIETGYTEYLAALGVQPGQAAV